MINAFVNSRGYLEIRADQDSRDDLAAIYADERNGGYLKAEAEVIDALRDHWEWVEPEWIAALTSAPIFCDDLVYADDGAASVPDSAKVFWFPNYMVIDPWQYLAEHGAVEFNPAPSDDGNSAG